MKQREQIWALSAPKTEKVWYIGTIIAENSQLEKEPPYPVWVVVRVKDDKGKFKYNIGTLRRIADGKCEVNLFPDGALITASIGANEEVRLWPDIEWFWKKMFEDDAVKVKGLDELPKNNTVIVKTGNAEAGFYYRLGKVLKSDGDSAEIELLNGLRMVVKRGHESRVRLWK